MLHSNLVKVLITEIGAIVSTKDLNYDNFQSTIDENKIVIMDFWAEWCGPCKAFAPIFSEASTKHTDIFFAKINTDTENELSNELEITSIPTLIIYREGVMVYRKAGAVPMNVLNDILQKTHELDMVKIHADIAKEK